MYRYHPDVIRFPQCLGVLGISSILRNLRLSVVRRLGTSPLTFTALLQLTSQQAMISEVVPRGKEVRPTSITECSVRSLAHV